MEAGGKSLMTEIRRKVGVVFTGTPTTSCAYRPSARTWPSAWPRRASGAPSWRRWSCALWRGSGWDFADRPPHDSLGQRRRVAVATVLAMELEILV
jgi:ABC-type glutathione transport system ATPase component